MKRTRRAFSLVELLMVTLIISACAGSMTAAYGTRRGLADYNACSASRTAVAGAMEAYNLTHDSHRADLGALVPVLVREGFLTHAPDESYGFDGRDVVCARHREPPPAGDIRVELPAVGLPLLAFLYALARFVHAQRTTRARRVAAPVPFIDPFSGPLATGPATSPAPVAQTIAPCRFCHTLIDGEPAIDIEGRPFHAECGEFYNEKLLAERER